MKKLYTLALLLSVVGVIHTKEVDLEHSRLRKTINMIYTTFDKENRLAELPPALVEIYNGLQEGQYVYSSEQLSEAIPLWEVLYGPIPGLGMRS